MSERYPKLQAAAVKLAAIGDKEGAQAVRAAASIMDASESEIDRLLVDIEVLQAQLVDARGNR